MYIYIFIFITSIACTLTSLFIERDKVHYLFKFCAALLVSYVCLRYRVGVDWDYYSSIYESASWSSLFGTNTVEPLFKVLCILFKYLHLDFYVLSSCIGVVTCYLVIKSISDYSDYPMLTLALMVIPFIYIGVTQIRQGLSLALIIYAFRYISTRNYLAYFSILIIAVGFHYSAMIAALFYFCNRPLSSKQIGYSIGVILVVCIIQIVFNVSHLNLLEHITFGHIQYKLQAYLLESGRLGITLKSSLWRFLVLGLAWYNYNENKSEQNTIFFNIYLFGLAIYLLNSAAPVIASRASFYCKVFECFILATLVKNFVHERKHYLTMASFFVFFFYFSRQFYYFILHQDNQFYVYKSYIPWVQSMLDRVSVY